MINIPIDEQETCITFMRGEEYAQLYTSDRTQMTRLDKLVKKNPSLFRLIGEDEVGRTYRFPSKLISIRCGFRATSFTDEQISAAAERLKQARELKPAEKLGI